MVSVGAATARVENCGPVQLSSTAAETSAIRDRAEVIAVGDGTCGLPAAIAALPDRGLRRIHREGGPTLLDRLTEADLVDELCVTLAPRLTAEGAPIADGSVVRAGPLDTPRRFRPKHAVAHDDPFLRYVRGSPVPEPPQSRGFGPESRLPTSASMVEPAISGELRVG
ncbi:dihydrofolate reductase family protein [Gordonia aurantiaca]|uniref:dihydrofolate reductase family protein n=1 Tax=Gordonia sp. B21 TaxID=3151852 RepID=UPI003265A445